MVLIATGFGWSCSMGAVESWGCRGVILIPLCVGIDLQLPSNNGAHVPSAC